MARKSAPQSMTGFARNEESDARCRWMVTLKSVNGKGLDVRTRMPSWLDPEEHGFRQLVGRNISRGNVTLSVFVENLPEIGGEVRINRPLLDQVIALAREIEGAGAQPPRIDALLSVRGIIETGSETETADELAARTAAIKKTVEATLAQMVEMRKEEGKRIVALVAGQLDEIEALVKQARALVDRYPDMMRNRMREQVSALLAEHGGLAEDRLMQEVALLLTRADVTEELDRLDAHIAAARDLLESGGGFGRKLDFLCQEFNREANTLCSKAADTDMTQVGLEMKSLIDQMREQTQNIE